MEIACLTLAGFIETVLSGYIEAKGERIIDHVFGDFRSRLLEVYKDRELPINHDLQRLYRGAFLAATKFLCDSLAERRTWEERSGAKAAGWEDEGGYDNDSFILGP